MKATYDTRTDTLSIILKPDVEIAKSDENKPSVILDYDADGNLVSLEIVDACRRVGDTRRIEFEMVGVTGPTGDGGMDRKLPTASAWHRSLYRARGGAADRSGSASFPTSTAQTVSTSSI